MGCHRVPPARPFELDTGRPLVTGRPPRALHDSASDFGSLGRRSMSPRSERMTNTEVFTEWQRCLRANDAEGTARVVDLEAYTEICLGLTPWTTGYAVAEANFYRNMIAPWTDLFVTVEDLQESEDGVTV